MEKIDALVVGAGVVGVTAALALQQRGLKVFILDQQAPGRGCSFGNAGLIVPTGFPLSAQYRVFDLPAQFLKASSPATLDWVSLPTLLPWAIQYAKSSRGDRVKHITSLLHQFGHGAIRSYELLLRSDLPPITRRGYLVVHLSTSEAEAAIRFNAIRSSLGAAVRMLSNENLAEMEPAIGGLRARATFIEQAAHVTNPSAFVVRLAEVFLKRGGVFRCERVESLELKGNRAVVVRGAREKNYSTGAVVLATGAHVNRLLAGNSHKIPLIAERGYHLELEVEPGFLSRPLSLPSLGVVLTPSERGARIAGLSHFGSPGLKPQPHLLLAALDRLRKMLPTLKPRPGSQVWSGERPATPDSVPIVEQVPNHHRLFVATGHGHGGLTLGAVTAQIVADLVTGKGSPYASHLSSQRFSIGRKSLRGCAFESTTREK
ncbi:D-amino-acid dehydrogenase [Bradyrhizobium sp. CIR18]|uniref:NAD(P)/FAD-dependent oxidoreductase n=1 Tax=Bradyrhizobium sp. CIR18 TaxID=2663839 RepID=UPI001605EB16|nr:FAD-dependent oxidoreductase [Bradyrhizobium sp. CIR18]MBB4365264.1 D-amino-acid dehydrogenase [Bradyrhizobium sp. CIR18]